MNEPINQGGPPDDQKTVTNDTKPVVNPPHATPEKPTADNDQWHAEQMENWSRQLIPQWVMVIISAGGVGAALFSLYILNGTLEATKDQAASARDAVNVARDSLNENLKALRLDQRAWLGLYSTTMESFAVGKPIKATIVLTNSGKSPALNTTVSASIKMSRVFDILQFKQDRGTIVGPPSTSTVFPNTKLNVPIQPGALTQEIMAEVSSGAASIYIFGEVVYSDIFNNHHTTEFCEIYNPVMNAFRTCPEGNTAN